MSATIHASPAEFALVAETDAPQGERGVTEVVAALGCLAGLLEPLVIEAELRAVDPELGIELEPTELAAPFHRLVQALPAGVSPRPRLPDPVEAHIDALTPAAVGGWLRKILAQDAGGQEVAWAQLVVAAARARAPAETGPSVQLYNLEAQPFEVMAEPAAEGGAWFAGPTDRSSMDPPLKLTFTQEGHRARLLVAAAWPLWSTPGSLGHALLQERVEQLTALGWVLA